MTFIEKSKKGAALAMVIIFFGALSILGTAMLSVSLAETKQVVRQEDNMQAYYAARSGADAMASYIIENPSEVSSLKSKTGSGTFNGVNFEVTLTDGDSPGELIIKSTGRAKGGAESNVSLTLSWIEVSSVFKHAIFTDGEMNLKGNSTVVGDIGTNSPESITFGKNKVDGDLYIPLGQAQDADKYSKNIEGNVVNMDSSLNMDSFMIDESKFEKADWNISGSKTFDVNEKKLFIMVDKIDVGGSSNLIINGDGELHILVNSEINVYGNANVKTTNGARLFIYYKGTKKVNLNGGPVFQGAIFAPNASVVWNGGGNSTLTGSIIAKSFDAGNSNVSIIYDERYNNTQLPITGGNGYRRKEWGN